MSSRASGSPPSRSLERLMYVLLIGASVVNLGANLVADVKAPPDPAECVDPALYPVDWVRSLLLISKPMLVPALAGLLLLSTRGIASSIHRGSFYAALFFCWIGDIALLDDHLFFYGLGAFGVAHILFIRSYLIINSDVFTWKSFAYGLPFIVYGYTLYSIIYMSLREYQRDCEKDVLVQVLAIAGYMVVLLSNGVTGFIRLRLRRDRPSSASILVGIVLFVQSDSIIAVTNYVHTLRGERFAIMATYILGLFLMVRGCILDARESAQPQAPKQPVTLVAAA